ncbi:MAG: hypothetical protein H0V07_13645 [Propionibacteriales bacterium]|nr:hypothetical protein [Propionibacteriales bacterium]
MALGLVASATATPALASGGGDDVRRSGDCSRHATWKLKAKHDNGRIEVEGEVDSNVVGQTWRWRILHNGNVSARGTKTTTAPSGSFTVPRRLVNASGTDSIGWRARNPATGETCRGGLTI